MKINGVKVNAPNVVPVPIIRETGDILILCGAVLDYEEFDQLCPRPEPRVQTHADGTEIPMVKEKAFLAKIEEWAEKRVAWRTIQSLKATEGLEWETVSDTDPESWANWREELKSACFSEMEVMRIQESIGRADGFSPEKIDEATKTFLAGLAATQKG